MSTNIRSKFRDRKRLFKKKIEEEENKLKENPVKIIFFLPLIAFGFIKKFIDRHNNTQNSKKLIEDDTLKETQENGTISNSKIKGFSNIKYHYLKENNNFIRKGKNSQINTISNKLLSSKLKSNKNNELLDVAKENKMPKSYCQDNHDKSDIDALEKKIIAKLKKKIITLKASVEISETEINLLNKYSDNSEILEEAQKKSKEIDTLIEEINKINDEYNLLADNNLIENPLLLDDESLIDWIIKYREKLDNIENESVTSKLKLLNEFSYLHIKLDKLEEQLESLKQESDSRIEELSSRNKKFCEAKDKVDNLDDVEQNCNAIIAKNNKYLEELLTKVDNIDERKKTEYKLKGLNGLLSASLKYIALLGLTPVRFLIPSLAAKTVATRKLVHNMIENIGYEKTEKVIYSLNNYQSDINNKLFNIDSLENNIDSALGEINRLKKEFQIYFNNYHLSEYEEVYSKIQKLEQDTLVSKEKTHLIKEKLILGKSRNREAILKVKKLNQAQRKYNK